MHFTMALQKECCLAIHRLSVLGVCMQAESYRGQDLSMLGQELSHKLARADA